MCIYDTCIFYFEQASVEAKQLALKPSWLIRDMQPAQSRAGNVSAITKERGWGDSDVVKWIKWIYKDITTYPIRVKIAYSTVVSSPVSVT